MLLKSIYATWTFCGGMIFSAAYLGTGGGLLLPVLLHFVNNAIVFGASARKVVFKMLKEYAAFEKVAMRVAQQQRQAQQQQQQQQAQSRVEALAQAKVSAAASSGPFDKLTQLRTPGGKALYLMHPH